MRDDSKRDEIFEDDVWPFDAPYTQRAFSYLPSADLVSVASTSRFFRDNANHVASLVLKNKYGITDEKIAAYPPAQLLKIIEKFNTEICKPIAIRPGREEYFSDITPGFEFCPIQPGVGILVECLKRDSSPCLLMIFATHMKGDSVNYKVCQIMIDLDKDSRVKVKSVTEEEAKSLIQEVKEPIGPISNISTILKTIFWAVLNKDPIRSLEHLMFDLLGKLVGNWDESLSVATMNK